ncbi:MAG: chromosome partitioning protein ParA [Oleispira sp.]|nr:chromosome partitioning protein ParA [Oleispira sp.]
MGNEQQNPNKDKTENTQIKYQQQSLQKQAGALEKKESELKEKQQKFDSQKQLLKQREADLAKDKESHNTRSLKLEARHQQQESKHLEIEQGLPALRDEIFAEREQQLAGQQQLLKQQLRDVAAKEQQLKAEREQLERMQETVDGDFSEQRADLQRDLQQKRSETITKLHNEVQQQREKDFKELEAEVQQRREDLEKREKQLEQDKAILTGDQNNVRFQQNENKQLKTSLEQIIAERTKTREEEFEQDQKQFEQEKQRLLNRIKHQDALHSLHDELEKALGDRSADEVLRDLTAKNEELIVLREELNRPSQELEEYYDGHRAELTRLEQDKQHLQNEKRDLQRDLDTQEQLEFDQERLQTKFNSLDVNYKAILADNNKLQETLDRLNPAYNTPESIEKRLKSIKRPCIQEFVPRRQEKNINELEWLEAIRLGIENHGLHFSYRILCAFHTALKTAEWSPLTVLAGVSGTGKSELPKLYSHFGGINFINVPVQPNWDSQESMLGYFNSISNSYESQPMLNFLVQSREKLITGCDNPEDNYNGLDDTVSLVLLDEMNLAHVELYFADFLSKLEQRRATKTGEEPHIDINLGADLDPYKLTLGRNLLFAGTMNQDETTKSLSDKVIDRGTLIYFPRPNSLHSRKKLTSLPKQADMLPRIMWGSWISKKIDLSEEVVKQYKSLIEQINECLGTDGRALGHRVWQSIEYYMVNHPLVIGLDADQYPDEHKEALKFAFEDQLVQKVMPKLRGIETRGYAKEHCLNPIRGLLAENKLDILNDFDKAMRIGHGQFSWASADYLNNEKNNERYQELFKLALEPSSNQKNVIKPEPETSGEKILAHRITKQPKKTHESKVPDFFKKKTKENV